MLDISIYTEDMMEHGSGSFGFWARIFAWYTKLTIAVSSNMTSVL